MVREFAWKTENHQREVTETGKWVEDGKGDPGTSVSTAALLGGKHRGAETLEGDG